MKIKELDITGFKSFVDRTTLAYEPGITAVVGPNGCGKSNIVDAIRWVMGEQSPRHLRGKDMEDVIFGGSEGRKPLGMAEVSITFSNEDGNAPEDYRNFSEIMVTRRLFRSGDSEYLINKVPCRLKDITELFMGTGVGTRAYSIVEQGQIGLILNSRPQDRRFLIEEAAGITKYKSRKKEALAKMESTRQNQQRVNDIIGEVRRQMNALDRQARKAEKFKSYRTELKEIELKLLVLGYMRLAELFLSEEEKLRCMEEEGLSMEARVSGDDSDMATLKAELMVAERVLGDLQERFYAINGELQKKEDRVEYLRIRRESIDKQTKKYSEELEQLKGNVEKGNIEIGSLEEELGKNGKEQEELELELSGRTEELESYRSVFEEKSRGLESLKGEMVTLAGELARSRNTAANLEKRIEEIVRRMEKASLETEGVEKRIGEVQKEIESLNVTIDLIRKRRDDLAAEREALIESIRSCQERKKEVELGLHGMKDELLKKSSHLGSLEALQAGFEGYGDGVKAVKLSESGERYTVISDILETAPEFEVALEASLEGRFQHMVVNNLNDGIEAISYLKSMESGRCGFIPLGHSCPTPRVEGRDAAPLLDKVRVKPGFESVASFLLGDTFVVRGLEEALTLIGGNETHLPQQQMRFVTLEGDILDSSGVLVGGSMEVSGHGILQRRREIKELRDAVAVLKDQVYEAEGVLRDIIEGLGDEEGRLDSVRKELHKAEIESVHLEKDGEKHYDEIKRLNQRLDVMKVEEEHLHADRLGFERELLTETEELRQYSVLKEERESSIRELQEGLLVYKGEMDRVNADVTDLRIKATSLKGREQTVRVTLDKVKGLQKELLERSFRREEEISEGVDEIEDIESEVYEIKKGLSSLLSEKDRLEDRLTKEREVYQAESEKFKKMETGRQRSVRELEALRKDVNAGELAVSKLRMEMENISARVKENHSISVEESVNLYKGEVLDEVVLSGRHQEVAGLVEGLGEVNLTAIEEFNSLEERFRFLSDQQTDLNRSMEALQTAIQRINSISRDRFRETFEAVNANFKVVFQRLFRGGRAEMVLTDSEDLLEAGIDIIAQPPGKRLQGVSLLSGGEKALTAISLIFAIFLLKPTPFCLLDEVDAPLDDANVSRFNDIVVEMSKNSQFILITHNKRTMEIADVLYGITMQEPGVSRLVSVRLREEQARAA